MFLLAVGVASASPYALVTDTCNWTDAPWQRTAAVAPDEWRPPAVWVDGWGGLGVRLSASLGQGSDGGMWLSGSWSQAGVTVHGVVDAEEQSPLRLSGTSPVRTGPTSALALGASLSILSEGGKGVVATASAPARELVEEGYGTAILPCRRLAVTDSPATLHGDVVGLALQRTGPALRVRTKDRLWLHDAPQGRRITRLAKGRLMTLRVLEERGNHSHVALAHDSGAVWHGWVQAGQLKEAPAEASGHGSGLLGMLGVERPTVRCGDVRDLWVVAEGVEHRIGTVAANTQLDVARDRKGAVEVSIPWLRPHDAEGSLQIRDAEACERATRKLADPFASEPLGELLGSDGG
ncbi:MAG: hypothetical protein KTR31_32290 [Myxococcales bacterium]|nr:hypothetical protein [Myxococcales bacterium]